jgi:transposase
LEGILKQTKAEIVAVDEDDPVTETYLTRSAPYGSKLTPEMVEKVRTYLFAGASINRATRAAGITPKTFFNWRHKAEDDPTSAYAEAFNIFEMAIAKSIVEDLAFIRSAKQGWQARAWRLERQFPSEFALVNRVTSTVDAVHTLRIEWGNVPIEASDDE